MAQLALWWHALRCHSFPNPCRIDSVIGDVLEKIFPTECRCYSALRGVLYGTVFECVVGISFGLLIR
jgi:hypothetical protein